MSRGKAELSPKGSAQGDRNHLGKHRCGGQSMRDAKTKHGVGWALGAGISVCGCSCAKRASQHRSSVALAQRACCRLLFLVRNTLELAVRPWMVRAIRQ